MDTQKILDMMAKNPAAAGVLGGLAGSLLGGAITGRKGGGSLVKMGGLAAVGYVAYQAWQRHQSKQQGQAAAPAPMLAQLPASVPDAFDLNRAANSLGALRVVQAMVAAGFRCYEVLEGHYRSVDNALAQVDLVFVPEQSALRSVKTFFSQQQVEASLKSGTLR